MQAQQDKMLESIQARLNQLQAQHEELGRQIQHLRDELSTSNPHPQPVETPQAQPPVSSLSSRDYSSPESIKKKPRVLPDLERFIGSNIAGIAGIIAVIAGLGIFVKYAIDRELIGPIARLALAYLSGVGMLIFSFRLFRGARTLSAVLFSGAMAVFLVTTYTAHAFLGFFSPAITFGLLVAITVLVSFGSRWYETPVIGLIGLTAAYAIPFAMGKDFASTGFMFPYLAVINTGILYQSVRYNWKILHWTAMPITWLIFSFRVLGHRDTLVGNESLVYGIVYFLIFYAAFLAFKLLHKRSFQSSDVVALLLHSFVFFGLGLFLTREGGQSLFSTLNAVFHLAIAILVYKTRDADKNLFYLSGGLFLCFLTVTIPVSLDGNWVSLLWAGEAITLFLIAQKSQVKFYFYLSATLVGLTLISLSIDLLNYHFINGFETSTPYSIFLSPVYLTSLSICLIMGYMYYSLHNSYQELDYRGYKDLLLTLSVLTFWIATRAEVYTFWELRFSLNEYGDAQPTEWQLNLRKLGQFMLSAITWSILVWWILRDACLVNRYKYPVILILGCLSLFFVFRTIPAMQSLVDTWVNQDQQAENLLSSRQLFYRHMVWLTLPAILFNLRTLYLHERESRLGLVLQVIFHTLILVALSSLLKQESTLLAGSGSSTAIHRAGYTILWSAYAFGLVLLGFFQKIKDLRLISMALFTIVLIKIVFHDVQSISATGKTLVFVAVGVLLLLTSFLYQKFWNGDDSNKRES
jgi:uncharacterized membrane protein